MNLAGHIPQLTEPSNFKVSNFCFSCSLTKIIVILLLMTHINLFLFYIYLSDLAFGSVVTFKNHRAGGALLHSHPHLYPKEHGPEQQQVQTT